MKRAFSHYHTEKKKHQIGPEGREIVYLFFYLFFFGGGGGAKKANLVTVLNSNNTGRLTTNNEI